MTMQAYDLTILPVPAARTASDCQGWCFGLPPGIAPEQWPLDPTSGYPLQHAFTLLLPEDYRCHGPDLVAVSLFTSAMDHNDGGPNTEAPEIGEAMAAADAPNDPDLLPFWRRGAHGASTPAPHDGPAAHHPCGDPSHAGRVRRRALPTAGDDAQPLPRAPAAARMDGERFGRRVLNFMGDMRVVQDMFGTEPAQDLIENRALSWTPRAHDPNAGRKPYDEFLHEPTDYIQPFFVRYDSNGEESYESHSWTEGHALNHIGGRCDPRNRPPTSVPTTWNSTRNWVDSILAVATRSSTFSISSWSGPAGDGRERRAPARRSRRSPQAASPRLRSSGPVLGSRPRNAV